MLYFPCPRPGISYFSKKSWLLLAEEWYFSSKAVCQSLLTSRFSGQNQDIYVYIFIVYKVVYKIAYIVCPPFIHFFKSAEGVGHLSGLQSVECPTLAQVMILRFVSWSPTSGLLLSAYQHRARFGSSVPLSLPLLHLCSPKN